ncbi:MAG: LytTR family DNA-binding domain-containing protein [Eubacteriaceae bacterium]|jgi:DNA-binding LytR/AlgR family response regulator|nr:LytTR family DNA-binding domain-containing protein [Eubacteriaceae bacterium]
MISIAICDDTSQDIELCSQLFADYSAEHPELDVELSTYGKSDDLLFDIESGRFFDLFILDIIMPELNGIDLGRKIHEKYPDAALVYVTTSTDYAVDAFSVYAFQYLIKPIRSEDFFGMLDTFLKRSDAETGSSMAVKTKDSTETVFFNMISHLECRGHVIFFTLTDGRTIETAHIRVPFLTYAAPLLGDPRFVSTHKSYIVNLDHVSRLAASDFYMQGGDIVPISRNNYSAIKKTYLDHISQKSV